jgi:hypothetical protein
MRGHLRPPLDVTLGGSVVDEECLHDDKVLGHHRRHANRLDTPCVNVLTKETRPWCPHPYSL